MELTPVADGLRVRCPGCGVVMVMHVGDVFVHQDDCAVYERIKKATREYEQTVVKHG
jgi:hypothetical protein